MRVTCWRVFLLTVPLLIALGLPAEQSQETLDARSLLRQSIAAMGGVAPASSLAVGRIEITEGSLQETGSIRILTRGVDESREEISTARGVRSRVFAKGMAAGVTDAGTESLSLGMAASSQSPNFPLPLLIRALNDPDSAFEYVGRETVDGAPTHHIRFWNTYDSQGELKHLAEFSLKDIWIDGATGFPRKLLYEEREGRGSAPRIAVGAIYSDYRDVGGVLYPFRIERIYNGTPWATVTVENVTLNADIPDTEFPVE